MRNVYDDTVCKLGEGPLWHPSRGQLFWFDILGHRMLTREGDRTRIWEMGEHVSAAGWVDDQTLLVASETALFRFDIETGAREDVVALEADNPLTRSNDGRADPMGGFWIGTMPKGEREPIGAFYRFYKGELRQLWDGIVIPNAICFPPGGTHGYFTDTARNIVQRVALDADGWPDGAPEDWLDLSGNPWGVDGAVFDADGNFWNAQWGGWRVACYSPQGELIRTVDFDGAHTSCPAFGGPDLTTLFATTAADRTTRADKERSPAQGMTFAAENVAKGQAEHRVLL